MGVYLSKAKTSKGSQFGGDQDNDNSVFGLTSMQGWRQSMEDAHVAVPSVESIQKVLNVDLGLYGVFDGHGGPAVSEWIAKHMTDVLLETCESVRDELVQDPEGRYPSEKDLPDEVLILCRALQKTFLKLDEDMQSTENREEIKQIHNDKYQCEMEEQQEQEKANGGGGGQQSLRGLLSAQPRTLIQALLRSGGKPMIKLVEQDGEQYFHISHGADEETAGADEKGSSSSDDSNTATPHHVEEIVEDDRVTAPGTKSPVVQQAAVELLKTEAGGLRQVSASTPAEENLIRTVEAHGTELNKTAVSDGQSQDSADSSSDVHDSNRPAASDAVESKHYVEVGPDDIPSEEESSEDAVDREDLTNRIMSEAREELSPDEEDEDERANLVPGGPESCGAAVVVAALVGGPKPFLITANAGDSRCVLCREGQAIALSEDHKPQLEVENNRITKAGGKIIAGRVDGNLNLSRTLGDILYKRNKDLRPEEQKITAFPDIRVVPVHEADEFVILACDGIWDCVTNQEACDFVKSRLTDDVDSKRLSEICEELCDDCLAGNPMDSEGGIGCDNMTCIIVLLNKKYRNAGVKGSATNVTLYDSEYR